MGVSSQSTATSLACACNGVSDVSANGGVGSASGGGLAARRPYHAAMAARLLIALLLLVGLVPLAAAQTTDWGPVEVCPALPGERSPPATYDRDACRRMAVHEVDPQGRQLWVRLPLAPGTEADPAFLGLLLAVKASSEVFLDGRLIGRNGLPGAGPDQEIAGRMDVVIPLPAQRSTAGASHIDLLLSSHHGWLTLQRPVHAIELVDFPDPQAVFLRYYLPSLLPLGIFLLAAFYFFSLTVRSERKLESALLGALAVLAGLQLLLEVSRGVFAYAYPMQDLRLIGIVACAIGFGVCLVAVHARLFAPRWLVAAVPLAAAATTGAMLLAPSLDAKTSIVLLTATALSLGFALEGIRTRQRGARLQAGALFLFGLANVLAPRGFLDLGFYLLVAALMVALMIRQAGAYGRERRLRIEQHLRADRLQHALDQAQAQANPVPRVLTVPGTGTVKQVPVDRIVRIQGAGDYVELHLDDGSCLLHTTTLNELDAELAPGFLRVHRSHLVNTRCIERLDRADGGTGTLYLRGGGPVPVSRRVMPGVRRALR
jgi:hypothetical protein